MIEFRGLVKLFGDRRVLDGVDLVIEQGSVVFIIGTSGAGKSVLMKHVVGLVRADAGAVVFDGCDVTRFTESQFRPVRERCGLVFQHATLFDGLSVLENVALPLKKRFGLTPLAARSRGRDVLDSLGLGAWMSRFPAELGAGVKKRVAIARTLALEPEYVIYDEPTTGLDPIAARGIDALILASKSRGITQIVVSHDLRSIFDVADRIAMLHLGRVHLVGPRKEVLESSDPVVSQFLAGAAEGPL